jgi:hypothetical protein
MSEPQRFRVADIQAQMTIGGQIMEVHPDGPYVTYSEYARLAFKSKCQTECLDAFDNKLREAEYMIERWKDTVKECQSNVRRLEAEVRLQNGRIDRRDADCGQLYCENARLEAEVERLTKAGDNLVYVVSEHPVSEQFVRAWFAAKNGGQP